MALKLNSSSGGSVTLQEPTTASNYTLTVPAQTATLATTVDAGNYYAFKNRIINGNMAIDQRNAGASVTNINGTVYSVDRWALSGYQASKFTAQQNAGSVTPPVGFVNYLGCTSSSAYTVGAGEYFVARQAIEGYNIADLGWGTANAKPVTLSFQVYSSLTGTFGGSISNNAVNRSYPFSYTVSSANTWTSVSITIAGDTTGTWLTTNGVGMYVYFSLGSGSTFSGTSGTWAGAQYTSATGATSVVGTNGATFYITGVQLEKGTVATSFDYRPYGTELSLCQRYFYTIRPSASSSGIASGLWFTTTGVLHSLTFPQVMRSSPTLTYSAASDFGVVNTTGGIATNSMALSAPNSYSTRIDAVSSIAGTAGQGSVLQSQTGSAALNFSAEL